jgi:hypothetical protein
MFEEESSRGNPFSVFLAVPLVISLHRYIPENLAYRYIPENLQIRHAILI